MKTNNKQSIVTNPEMTQILQFANKNFKSRYHKYLQAFRRKNIYIVVEQMGIFLLDTENTKKKKKKLEIPELNSTEIKKKKNY